MNRARVSPFMPPWPSRAGSRTRPDPASARHGASAAWRCCRSPDSGCGGTLPIPFAEVPWTYCISVMNTAAGSWHWELSGIEGRKLVMIFHRTQHNIPYKEPWEVLSCKSDVQKKHADYNRQLHRTHKKTVGIPKRRQSSVRPYSLRLQRQLRTADFRY